jgi:TonB family protein
MAETAPCVPLVPEGLIYSGASNRRRLAKAVLVSLMLHAALLAGYAFPQLTLADWFTVGGGRLVGELRPAQEFAGSHSADPSPVRTKLAQAKKVVAGARRELAPPFTGGKTPSSPLPAEAQESVAVASLSAYRLAVARQVRQFRYYPSAASAAGAAAEVLVGIDRLPGASWPVVRLLKSSGNRQFDEAALAMIEKAVRLAPLPAELHGRHLQVELPVHFLPDI